MFKELAIILYFYPEQDKLIVYLYIFSCGIFIVKFEWSYRKAGIFRIWGKEINIFAIKQRVKVQSKYAATGKVCRG